MLRENLQPDERARFCARSLFSTPRSGRCKLSIEAAGALGKGVALFNDKLHCVGIAIVGLFAAIVLIQIGVVEGGRAFLQSRASGRGWLDRRNPGGLLE